MHKSVPWFLTLGLAMAAGCHHRPAVDESVAQVERVRAGVTVTSPKGTEGVAAVHRVSASDVVHTDGTGRAVLALDGGGRYVLDHDSAVRVTGARAAALEAGRLWISGGGEGGREEDTALTVGGATLHLRGARASVALHGQRADVEVLAGEVAFESGPRRGAVHAGETAHLQGAETQIAAEHVFEDWTGGLADDLPGGGGDAAGLGAVAARRPDESGAPRWPMVMQRLDAHVVVRGDLAITTLDQTFFNPSGDTVEGIYTFHTPQGAVLQSFGVDRRGQMVDGIVREREQAAAQYQAQVYVGSTHDPALLEWDAPGRYHARLYPIAPGATRRVRVRFAQWLDPDTHGGRVYRLPLTALETRIGELRADFDLDEAAAQRMRTGVGARLDDGHLYIAQSDVIPRSDLVVEFLGNPPEDVAASRVSYSEGDGRGNFLRLAVRAPAPAAREVRDEGVDLVVVVDHSAATDGLGLRLEQAFVESLLGALDSRDNVLVLAGDVTTRPLGAQSAQLRPATAENRRAVIEALTADRLGGATDLGAMVTAAQAALRPGRNGAVVYVGDGNATVGEAQLPALRQAFARLAPRPRFYAIAVGEAPRLDLLQGLAAPAGFAARVARRGDVARTALDLVEHASRPLVRNFRVELGSEVTAVYPNAPVDLPAGEPLVVVGRFTSEPPKTLTVRALWNGAESTRTLRVEARDMDDGGDLRYRWANMRLENLLARGESRPVIVELGTRYGLITPYTSLYVRSEDEVSALEREERARAAASTRVADLSLFDLLPLVGCARSADRAAPASTSSSTPSTESAPGAATATQQNQPSPAADQGGEEQLQRQQPMGGAAAARSAHYAAAPNADPSIPMDMPRAAAAAPPPPPAVVAAVPQAQAAPTPTTADTTTARPMAGLAGQFAQRNTIAGRDESGHEHAADALRAGDDNANGYGGPGGLGTTGTGAGGGGSGEGTIGLGNIGTIGHGAARDREAIRRGLA